MKSLLLKDLYNISYNAKAMLLIMVIMTAAVVPTAGAIPQMAGFTILWAMMEVTTFTFDETSGWTAYALVLPLRRSDIVRAKFVVLAIFCTVGVLLGLAVSGAASFLMGGRLPEENGPLVGCADPGCEGGRPWHMRWKGSGQGRRFFIICWNIMS